MSPSLSLLHAPAPWIDTTEVRHGEAAAPRPSALGVPPSLGTVPPVSQARALALSCALYGGLGAGVLGLAAAATPVLQVQRQTTTVVLDAYDAPAPAAPAPPPAASPAPAQRSETSQPATPDPVPTPQVPSMLPVAQPPAVAGVVAGGQPGGVAGGQPGGVQGGVSGGAPGGTGVAVVPPRFDAAYLQNPEPEYPALAQQLNEEGRVLLRVLVSPEGRAEQVELKQGSGFSRLDQAALAAVKRWRFQPARRGAESVAAWVLVPITFHLDA